MGATPDKAAKSAGRKPGNRKTQSQRREETQRRVLESAIAVFGEKGYDATSLEDIAQRAGLTITPIYHYFGNKLTLFDAVTEAVEAQLVERFDQLEGDDTRETFQAGWDLFVQQCQSPGFVQIVLIDSPHVLGRERWQDTAVVRKMITILQPSIAKLTPGLDDPRDQELILRMLMAALAEVALTVGRDPDYDSYRIIRHIVSLM